MSLQGGDAMITIDIETTGLHPWDSTMRLISFIEGTQQIQAKEVSEELKSKLADENTIKVFHNAVFDVGFLVCNGYKVNNFECTWLMAKVLGEWSCKLKDLAEKYLGVVMNKQLQHGENWTQELTQEHYDYALQDVIITQQLYPVLRKQLEERGLLEVYERENKANAIIPKLNNHGICFDFEGWDKVLEEDRSQMKQIEGNIKSLLKDDALNLNSPKQLIQALQNLGVEIPGTSDEVLAEYEDKHPVLPLLRKYRRKGVKVRTYGSKLKEAICSDGRIRASWKIIGTTSGRMACKQPPLQSMPGKSKEFFRPQQGYKFIIADYSQVELRVLAEISKDKMLKSQFESDVDLHKGTAALIFGKAVDEVTKEERQVAKSLNFGMAYGITEYGIQKNLIKNGLEVSLESARQYRLQFLEVYQEVQQLQDRLLKSYAVKSLGGRRWECEELSLTQRLNYPIQGSAADGLKEALILLDEQLADGWKICAVIHDEIVLEVPEEDAEKAKQVLEACMITGMKKIIKQIPVELEIVIQDYWIK